MREATFITEPTGQSQPWHVTHAGLEYSGEVVVAERWEPRWGETLRGDCFFRIVFLTEPQRGEDMAVRDHRIAVCLPRGQTRDRREIDQGLKSIGEARGHYSVGRRSDTGQVSSFLAAEEAKLHVQLLLALSRSYAGGRIVTAVELTLDPAQVFSEEPPAVWVQEVAALLLRHAYPRLPLDPSRFPASLTQDQVEELFDALFSSDPGPQERRTLKGFGPGLGLARERWDGSPLLEAVGRLLERRGVSAYAAELLEQLAHQEGVPHDLGVLALLAFVARNRPAVELTLLPGYPIRTRTSSSFSGSRLTWDLLPELAWAPDLRSSLDALQILQPPTWPAILPYLEAVYPDAVSAHDDGEHPPQRLFLQALNSLRSEVQGLLESLATLAAGLAQPLPAQVRESMRLLLAVTAADSPVAYCQICLRETASPSVLRRARELVSRLQPLGAAAHEVLALKQYLEAAQVAEEPKELAAQGATLRAQFDLGELATAPGLWPALRAQATLFQRHYGEAYQELHARYYREARGLRRRLGRVWPRMEALERLNLLAELGPVVASELPDAFRRLSDQLQPCEALGERLDLETRPVCHICDLLLTDKLPKEEVEEALTALEEALEQQNRRISAFVIGHVLERPDTARVDRFLELVRAADLDALADVLDDRVLSFLRTFLGQP